ncbi:MAG: TetR/AcrR family transcriptional regulator [Treponema sp.]|nr:TetR/AcrR family transcriptional regulator [Treponema sp.]
MSRKNISQEKIIQSFLSCAFEKSAGATSLSDIADCLEIKKASLYNHFTCRDEMYNETVELCKKEISSVNFLADKTIDSIKNNKVSLQPLFKRLIVRYFELFEAEPLYQMYIFIRTEQYFSLQALEIIKSENEKLADEIKKIILTFSEVGKCKSMNDKDAKDCAYNIASIILQQKDLYLANRKEVIRQNPEAGIGSLFALPMDETAVNRTAKLIEVYLSTLENES